MIMTRNSNLQTAVRAWRRQAGEPGRLIPAGRPLSAIKPLRNKGQSSVASQAIVNNCVNQPPPGPPSAGVRPYSAAGGRVLGSTQPAPLLVLARCGAKNQITKKQEKVPNSFQDLTQ